MLPYLTYPYIVDLLRTCKPYGNHVARMAGAYRCKITLSE